MHGISDKKGTKLCDSLCFLLTDDIELAVGIERDGDLRDARVEQQKGDPIMLAKIAKPKALDRSKVFSQLENLFAEPEKNSESSDEK